MNSSKISSILREFWPNSALKSSNGSIPRRSNLSTKGGAGRRAAPRGRGRAAPRRAGSSPPGGSSSARSWPLPARATSFLGSKLEIKWKSEQGILPKHCFLKVALKFCFATDINVSWISDTFSNVTGIVNFRQTLINVDSECKEFGNFHSCCTEVQQKMNTITKF